MQMMCYLIRQLLCKPLAIVMRHRELRVKQHVRQLRACLHNKRCVSQSHTLLSKFLETEQLQGHAREATPALLQGGAVLRRRQQPGADAESEAEDKVR